MNLSEKSATSRVHANPSAQAQPPFSPRPGRHEARCLDHRGRNGKPAPELATFDETCDMWDAYGRRLGAALLTGRSLANSGPKAVDGQVWPVHERDFGECAA